ncbi:MAG: c-type cytochrome [Nitrospinota bacterium]|nr:c-type cytochrome [Nitrospinota bacterium]
MENPEEKEEPPFQDEKVSYSFLFFMISGATLLVTLWAFWDDEYSRRGYKAYQEKYHQVQYARAEENFKAKDKEIASKEKEIQASLRQESGRIGDSEEYQRLVDEARESEIALNDLKEEKKFAGSRLDESYYYYKKAMHDGANYDVQLAKMLEIEKEIKDFDPLIAKKQKIFEAGEAKLLEFKAKQTILENELQDLTRERGKFDREMDFYKPLPFFWKPADILQTVILGQGRNAFAEIIYKVDRCMTCHVSYNDPHYENSKHPLKSHPNREILIAKHPPEVTGCTWCHYGQGSATAPAEHAHGSHHEMDQTVEINEPILHGDFMQATCRNCHAEVVNLEGAPVLSKAKNLFIKLGCHGCHLAEGYANERKVGPRLTRISSKVDPSWLFRWVKKPKKYLPKTRMPDFGLNDKDAVAISAYLFSASQKDYELVETYSGGDPEKGQKLFESVGCQACHELNGKGEVFGPDLSRIAEKVNADWLVTWLSNPESYNDHSIMPNLRLQKSEASDITAYLMQFGEKQVNPQIEELIRKPDMAAYGEKLIRGRGCFACHDIKGMEDVGRIAPELSAFGRKLILELEFGDAHVPHTWESWARTKLRKPDSFRTERVLDKMPNFHLSDDDINALVVLLRGFNGTKIPGQYRKILNKKEKSLERGRRLITKYNCKGCHHVEGEGGRIQKYLKSTAQYPPPLENGPYHVGERIKGSWLFSFLKNPTPVRTWVKVRMPTFFPTDEEVRDLTAYFEALAPQKIQYEAGIHVQKHLDSIETGVKIVNYMDCGKCHDEGEKGIDFSIAGSRLRQEWIPRWLKDTRALIPWTKMPSHWDKEGEKYLVKTKFSELETVGPVDQQVNHIKDFIVAYNTAEFDDSLVLSESAGDGEDEEDAEEEEGDEEEEDDE